MKIVIIPARGGSKRILRKNIQLFHGKPIIVYAIENALKSNLFDAVFVSTDDEEIADIAKNHGATVPILRSTKNADDFATTSEVLLEVIEYYNQMGTPILSACCIYPTSPLIEASDLVSANEIFRNENFETLISSVQYSFPIQRAFSLEDGNKINLIQPEYINSRSQDLEKSYHDAGAFYFFEVASFIQNKSLWSGNIGAYELPESKVQDIDTPEDWEIAELKYQLLK